MKVFGLGLNVRHVAVAAALSLPVAVAGVATAGASTPPPPPTAAAQQVVLKSGRVVSTDPSKRTKAEEAAYRDEITSLEVTGKLDSAAMKRLGLRLLTAPTASAPQVAAPPASAGKGHPARVGYLASSCGVNDAKTSASAMTVYASKITVNYSSQGYIMYATSTFKWASPPESGSTCQVKVGGPDGFAFSFNKSVTNLGTSFRACNLYDKCGTYGWLETNSQYGSGFAFQDIAGAWPSGYSPAYKGTITYAFRANTSTCTQAFAKYAHTWSSTSVNGFSIGPWSIGVQWSSSSSQWQKSGQAGSFGC